MLTNEGEWVVAGGGRKPSGAGGEFFKRGLEWRRELCNDCKPFLDREGLGLILIFNIESTPALSSFLLQPFVIYVQKKVDIFGREHLFAFFLSICIINSGFSCYSCVCICVLAVSEDIFFVFF